MKHFLNITLIGDSKTHIDSLPENSIVIYSPSSLGHIGAASVTKSFISTHDIDKDAKVIELFCKQRRIDVVVGLGGGTAIDIAKYMAYVSGAQFKCIPAMLTTNAFATNKAALMQNGFKTTINAKMADEIIFDPNLLINAGKYNLYGICDILSIHTALYDWQLASQHNIETIDKDIYIKANYLLGSAIRYVADMSTKDNVKLMSLFKLIGESGHITNLYGSGRPESGSEHIFAKELESRVEIPHGISISIGILLMSYLQNNHSFEVEQCLRQMGVLSDVVNQYNLEPAIKQTLKNITPRRDRYTILNQEVTVAKRSVSLTSHLYTSLTGVTNEYSNR